MNIIFLVLISISFILKVLSLSTDFKKTLKCNHNTFFYSFKNWLEEHSIDFTEFNGNDDVNNQNNNKYKTKNPILSIKSKNLNSFLVHIIPSPLSLEMIQPSEQNHLLTTSFRLTDKNVIHLHEDVWKRHQPIVKARLLSKIGHYESRIFARKCIVRRIDKKTAIEFLKNNHLWGATNAKYNYALFYNDEIVAITSFSPRRNVKRGKNGTNFRSHELIRFCTSLGITVIGGLSKLIKAFIREHSPDDIITTIDRDFGSIDSWVGLGFRLVCNHPPLPMVIDANRPGLRLYLLGAGLAEYPNTYKKNDDNNNEDIFSKRFALPVPVLGELNELNQHQNQFQLQDEQNHENSDEMKINADGVRRCLSKHGYFIVYDAGIARMLLPLHHKNTKHVNNDDNDHDYKYETDVTELWQHSVPCFPLQYYSNNAGVMALVREAAHNFPNISLS